MSIFEQGDVEEVPVQKLWRAVIARTVQEWISGPLRVKREAENFLFGNSQDYRTVCFSAGINPDHLRGRLQKYKIIPIRLFEVEAATHGSGTVNLNRD